MREATIERSTKETSIRLTINLDGGEVMVDTGIPFLDHMLNSSARHGGFGLSVKAEGDLEVDSHHTVEDVGIVLGSAIKEAVGDGRGITRFAHMAIPMDEAIAYATLDVGGRGYLVFRGEFSGVPLSGIPGDLFEHFFYSLCTNAGITAHLTFSGRNDHHMCEAVFKAFGVALGQAVRLDGRSGVPSTKGVL